MECQKILVGIAHSHKAFRQALHIILAKCDSLQVIFEAEDDTSLLSLVQSRNLDVLLLDLNISQTNGVKVLERIHYRFPHIRVLIFSSSNEEAYILKCLEFGVNGFLTKSMDINEVINAIQTAYKNEVYLNQVILSSYIKKYIAKFKKNFSDCSPKLSLQEIEIVKLLKEEKSTDEIANIMCLSKRSIEIKKEKLKEKLRVKTVGGILLYCYKVGIID